MSYSKKKFNIIVCITLALISIVVAFSTIDFTSPKHNTSIDQADAETGEDNKNKDGENADSKDNTNQGENNQNGMTKTNPSFTSGAQALSYALDMLKKYDHRITKSQAVDAKAGSIGGVQKVNEWIYNVGGKSYIKTVADGSAVPAGQGENYTEFKKIEGSNIAIKRNGLTTQTTAQYLSVYGILPNAVPYDMNAAIKTIPLLKDDPGKSYYTVSVTLNAACWKNYVKNMTANGGAAPSMKAITLTVKIDKAYGTISSISAVENYTISRGGFNAEATASISYVFDYSGNYSSAISAINSQLR